MFFKFLIRIGSYLIYFILIFLFRDFTLFLPLFEWVDWILSAMDGTPLSIGGGGSGVGPSNRPLPDLNLPPAAEPEPASSSELRETERLLQEAREELPSFSVVANKRKCFSDLTPVQLTRLFGRP